MKRLVCFWGVLFLLVWSWEWCALDARAAVARVPIEELAREAELIAVVSVLTVQDVSGTALAIATLQLREILKAPPEFAARSIEVRFQSPRVPPGTRRQLFSPAPTYRPGERAVVFLKASSDGSSFETVGGLLGKRTISQGQVAFENIGLDAFLARIRAAISPPSVPPDRGSGGPSLAPIPPNPETHA